MSYEDLSDEKAPKRKLLIPEGWRNQQIVSVVYGNSKKGNPQFVFGLLDKEKNYTTDVYAVNLPGKRWVLKSILDACGYKKVDGKYDLSEENVIKATRGKEISCYFEHEDNEWINRHGETVIEKQHRIVEFKQSEEIEWDKDWDKKETK